MADKKSEILYETTSGTVKIEKYKSRLKILYGNLVIEQSEKEFNYLQKAINGLYGYVKEVRQIYYRKFLIQLSRYKFSLMLNSAEIIELYELLGGAKTMMDLDKLIDDALKSGRKDTDDPPQGNNR